MNYGDGQTQNYAFDAMGNRTNRNDSVAGSTISTFDAANRLLTAGGNTYTNDTNGNTLTGGGRTMTWDGQNRMVSCVSGSNSSTFTYGADGLRRRSVVNGTATDFVLDGQSVVQERRNGAVSAVYFTGAQGPAYRRDASGVARWYVYDGLGSVAGEVDPSGNLTASSKYDVYGGVRSSTGTRTTSHGFAGALGHPSEAETGLIYMRARYYDPNLGRFSSEDLKAYGTNWFTYCNDNPINQIDKNGCNPLLVLGAIATLVSAVLGGVAECIAFGFSIANFLRGAAFAAATTIAGLAFGPAGGALVGALTAAWDAIITHGDPVAAALAGGLFGGIGGAIGAACVVEGKVVSAIAAHDVALFLLAGTDIGLTQVLSVESDKYLR